MTYKDIIQSIRNKQYKPLYFIHGDEAYFIDLITKAIEKDILSEAEQSFNLSIFYGKDADPKHIIDTACRYPMMASHQVVILKEAQEMRNLTQLQAYMEKPVPTTIFLICYKHKRFDKRTKFAKALGKQALVYEAKKLYDNQVPDWISQYLKSRKLTINTGAAVLIAEYLGTNLSKIVNELDKLAINLPAGATVDKTAVQKHIGISKDYNVFELQKALGQGNVFKTNQIIHYFTANPKKNPLVMVIGALYNFFSKVYMVQYLKNSSDKELAKLLKLRSDYFVRDYKQAARQYDLRKLRQILGLLREYDLKSKGVNSDGTSNGELLRELTFRILH